MNPRAVLLKALLVVLAIAQDVPPSGCTEIASTPRLICGQHGFLVNKQEEDLGPQIVEDSSACRDLCIRHKGPKRETRILGGDQCTSFSFNSTSNYCKLHSLPLSSNASSDDYYTLHFQRDDSLTDIKFWSHRCFDCPKACPQSQTATIVDNPGFELSSRYIGPWASVPGHWTVVTPGHKSSRAIFCHAKDDSYCNLQQIMMLCPGQLYAIRFDFKTEAKHTGSCHLAVEGGNWELDMSQTPSGAKGKWETVTTIIPKSASHAPKSVHDSRPYGDLIFLGYTPECSYYLDNVEVFSIPEPVPTLPGSDSLLLNGGFESSSVAPWHIKAVHGSTFKPAKHAFSIRSPGIASDRALHIYTPNGYRNLDWSVSLRQHFDLVPDKLYVVTFDYQFNGSTHVAEIFAGHSRWRLGALNQSYNGSLVHNFIGMFTSSHKTATFRMLKEVYASEPGEGRRPVILDNFSIKEFAGNFNS